MVEFDVLDVPMPFVGDVPTRAAMRLNRAVDSLDREARRLLEGRSFDA